MLEGSIWPVVALSLKVGLVASVVTLPIAFALAWLLARTRFPGKILIDGLVHLPLVVPPVVTGWLLLLAFAPAGPVGSWLEQWFGISVMFRWTGAAIAAGVMALPLMVRAMRLSIEAVDRRLENAARTLGASRSRVFRTITLPLALPGVLAAAMLGFARALGEFGATITFVSNVPGETQTLPLAIYAALQTPDGEVQVLRLALISVALSLAALVASELLARRAGRGVHVL
ncbi:molybdate ABC transporter permease subunit [Sphingomonas koreensis]|jgi:molybdate transport system permease protein|uniref:Molybdenum transport system permease n=1 Tax=Sphingomonas koreensis TaxID=93064 RepID=A0A1L6JDY0_9SPHN|nr:molybdate ABC transporter permease subunit [Sphingomonas koreensis]APR54105.1 molybdate ABC transporter permease [Sphingomonas koreensis]MDC7809086.1 molybdate ABC transporter permease subunit [Sphingomonas koreensis]RSU18741.1 molybdate ABC transporter permease subunit [Sphingomonas koreensis]RSU25517.1 molybdate ABC transporter permease subunit [Sphingomonas koreensis]RSU25748.1 molybdate ABC transporter permease subunit [Sphingomonas koreensis]